MNMKLKITIWIGFTMFFIAFPLFAQNRSKKLHTLQTDYAFNVIDHTDIPDTLMTIQLNGNVGIGVTSPDVKLVINGCVKITDGNEGLGKVLTSDADGKGTWQSKGYALFN